MFPIGRRLWLPVTVSFSPTGGGRHELPQRKAVYVSGRVSEDGSGAVEAGEPELAAGEGFVTSASP